jgi:predicted HAD superfamily Cof-like phosphohydrolase
MENPIKSIYKWQVEAGLADRPYDDFLESSFQIEEALEGFNLEVLGDTLTHNKNLSPKDISRVIVDHTVDESTNLPDVDRFDKAIDAVVFAIGSMAKLGLSPQQIQRGLLVVNHANMQKLGMPVDEHGKKIKPEGFVGPEEELQKILDERKSNDKKKNGHR